MFKAWGSDIPPDEISYQTCDSSSREFELFGADPKLIPKASPAATTGPIIASTVPTTSTFSDSAKDITAIEATANPDDNTVFKASNPFGRLSRLPSESVHPGLRDLRMRIQNRGPKLTFNKLGPFVTEASPELASRDLASDSNVNTDFDAPRTESSPESTFPTASPGSVVFDSQPTTRPSTAPQDSESHPRPDLMDMSTGLDRLENDVNSFKEYLQGGERGSKVQQHRRKFRVS